MFQLSIIKDTIPVQPCDFGLPAPQALTTELNKKYANKVLHNVGLGICVFDFVEVGEGKVRYGDGLLWYRLTFRLVVFRPFVSEVILAKVQTSDHEGMRLSLGFFDDIYIPAVYLPQPSTFDPIDRAHFWLLNAPDGADTEMTMHQLLDTPKDERLYILKGDTVRVRVEADEFYDDEPGPVKKSELNAAANPASDAARVQPKRSPYTITCSMAEQGLGPIWWWNGGEAEEGDDDAMDQS
ncbi:polymerase III polypeptide H [Fistulina hepatica ATCC 64428]|uniref:Polymerase III polypeptide H n=1 Tax=Fistulina hepatica ATCC 64428 TaxID=1128425 RepID=A0A0D7AK06_9AGAR|nr:polymerase III polypeptide H [Fistulina hepatica ATCC 64428]